MTCTQMIFVTADNDPDVRAKSLLLFDHQVKYIEMEEHQRFIRVKIYVRGDEQSIDIDFLEEDKDKYILFLKSVCNN
ncbi:TPA: hypothetical protein DEP21_03755 [Patescibacteria group bacterium]|nr:hypothetical protein [Candidatus Gracilibacteria bacterium]